jgi:Exocyst complex component SEC3 N-terminal PIP2 binding PH
MSALKNILLKYNFFNENETKIISVLSVCKLNARKSRASSVLVLISHNETGFLSIVEIKIQEKGHEFKKKRSWQLDEIKSINVHHNEHELEIVVGDSNKFQYAAILLNEKQIFITNLYKCIQKSAFISNKAIFHNIPESWTVDSDVNLNLTLSEQQNKIQEETSVGIEFDEQKELIEIERMLENESSKWLGDCKSVIRKIIFYNKQEFFF